MTVRIMLITLLVGIVLLMIVCAYAPQGALSEDMKDIFGAEMLLLIFALSKRERLL